jgi:polyisoprenoid-binding protein YceI
MGPAPKAAVVALLVAACGGASAPSPAPTTPSPVPVSATPAGTGSTTGPWTFAVESTSKTTVRVREVLAQVRAPGDAVLSGTGVKGSFTVGTDGAFSTGSKITADLTTLRSDQSQRDVFIKDNTLQTRRFPTAEFIPDTAGGLTLPLPASGEFTFTLSGRMTIHGVTKIVTFDLTARRDGARLTATARANPSWKFADFGMQQPRVASVLSIEDDIRVEIALVATEAR